MTQLDDAVAMARAVKRARGAMIGAVRPKLAYEEGYPLRAAHAQVFEGLDPGGTRLTTLAERAEMTHQAMGALVDDLVQHGYLERVPDPADRRARLIRPTDQGHAEFARAAEQLCRLRERWEAALDGITVAQVVAALQIFIQVCEDKGDG